MSFVAAVLASGRYCWIAAAATCVKRGPRGPLRTLEHHCVQRQPPNVPSLRCCIRCSSKSSEINVYGETCHCKRLPLKAPKNAADDHSTFRAMQLVLFVTFEVPPGTGTIIRMRGNAPVTKHMGAFVTTEWKQRFLAAEHTLLLLLPLWRLLWDHRHWG